MMRKVGRTIELCVLLWAVALLSVTTTPRTANAAPDTSTWYSGALLYNKSPVDLSSLNHRPAGKYGFVEADGDRLVFENGMEARFWGGNLAASALFDSKARKDVQAKRIAQLGYNLMRIHHHDSMSWVNPTVIDKSLTDSQHLSAAGIDGVDYWIKCLRDRGVYIWIDLHVGRIFKAGDAIPGFDEILAHGGEGKGYMYYNTRMEELVRNFNELYMTHVNPYTGLAYKDDPAIIGMELTNENDLTNHFGNLMLADKNNPYHNAIFEQDVTDYAALKGLPRNATSQTWLPGPSKIYLNDREYEWNVRMMNHLRGLGVRVPIAGTQMWGDGPLFSLPALTAGGAIDMHSYGGANALIANPRTTGNYITYLATGQAYGKPVTITEWNVPFPATDRFTAPLYVASIAALQGWDAPMIYNYSQDTFGSPSTQSTWSTYSDAALTGMMPAAAVLYRQGHVRPALEHYCLTMTRTNLYYQSSSISTMASLRTLVERSRLSIGLPDIPELPWDSATPVADGVTPVTNINQDYIPAGRNYVDSDTGELRRNWAVGFQTINTSGTQAAQGVLTTQTIALSQTTIRVTTTPQAAVAVTSLDRRPLGRSRRVLVTALARVVGTGTSANRMPMRSEPVAGEVTLRAPAGLQMLPLTADGLFLAALAAPVTTGTYTLGLPAARGTHWFLLQDDPALAQPGLATCPPVVKTPAVPVSFDGTTTGTSGLKLLELWYSQEPGGTWTDSTLTTTALAGTFQFAPPGNVTGTYHFQLVAVNNSDQRSADPDGPGDCTTLYDPTAPSVVMVRALAMPTTGTQTFDVPFSEPVTGFDSPGDVTIVHNPTGTTAHTGVTIVPVSTTRYTVTVQGLSGSGSFAFSVSAGACADQVGWPNAATTPVDVPYPPPPPKTLPPELRLY